MSKQLSFTFDGKEYCLEYTRKSVEQMERSGFKASEVEDKPMTVLPALFAGSFLANHRFTKQETIDRIFACMTNKGELIGKLVEMYNEPIKSLLEEPEENEGNVSWTAGW